MLNEYMFMHLSLHDHSTAYDKNILVNLTTIYRQICPNHMERLGSISLDNASGNNTIKHTNEFVRFVIID